MTVEIRRFAGGGGRPLATASDACLHERERAAPPPGEQTFISAWWSCTHMATDRSVPFDWLSLDDGEEVVWADTPHRSSLVPALVVGLPLTLVLVGIPIVVGAYLSRENTEYVVTNRALYRKTGILSRNVQRVDFGKVQNTTYSQGLFGQRFGYGTVEVSTAGGSGVELTFDSIPEPKRVQELVNRRATEDGEDRPESTAAVLDEILDELRAIRTALDDADPESERSEAAASEEP
jgi:membrane protein YdbS with pleckstrin-like domain